MASAYSQVETYLPYTPTTDIALIDNVLATKQVKYDANVAKIDQALTEYGNIDIMNQADKEHLYNNLTALTNDINSYGKLKLSSNDVTRNILNKIGTALDDRTKQSILNTQKIRNYQKQWDEIRKKDPNKYSDTNYQVGLMKAGVQEYLKDETGTVTVGNLTATPFVDISSEITKRLKDISAIKGGKRTIQIRDTDGSISGQAGTIINKEISGFTQEELKSILPSLVDSSMRDQMRIDGYYAFQNNKDVAISALDGMYEGHLNSIDEEIKNLQTNLNSGRLSPSKQAEYKNKISTLEDYKTDQIKTIDRIKSQSADAIGGYIQEQTMIDNLSKSLKGSESNTYIKDQVYFANLEAEAEKRKNLYGVGGTPTDITSTPIPSDLPGIDTYAEVKKQALELDKGISSIVTNEFNKLTDEQKGKVNSLANKPEYANLPERDRKIQALKESGYLDPEVEGSLNSQQRKYRAYLEDDERIYEESLKGVFNNVDLYDEFQSDIYLGNSLIKVVDEKTGEKVTYKKYLEDRGVNSEESYLEFVNDTDRSKTFKAKVISDMLLSADTASTTAMLSNNNLGKNLLGREAGRLSKNVLLQFDRITKTLGEGLKFTDVFDVRRTTSLSDIGESDVYEALTLGITPRDMSKVFSRSDNIATDEYIVQHQGDEKENYAIRLKDSAKNTETYKVIKQSLEQGTYDRSSALGEIVGLDNSLQDEGVFRTAFGVDKFEESYRNKIAQYGIRVKGMNQLSIAPTTGVKDKIPAFEDLRDALGHADISGIEEDFQLKGLKNGVAVNLRDSGDFYMVRQGDKLAKLPKSAITRYPALANAIDLEEGAGQIVIEKGTPLKVENINYKPSSQKTLTYLGNRYGYGSNLYTAATRQGAKDILSTTFPQMYGSKRELDPEYENTFNKALDTTDKFTLQLSEYQGIPYIEVFYDGEKISEVGTSVDKSQLEDILDYDPQVFITNALQNIAIELKNQNTENFQKLYGRVN